MSQAAGMDLNFQSLRITFTLAAQGEENSSEQPYPRLLCSPSEHPDWLRRALVEKKLAEE